MDDEDRDLVNRLFALATAILETAQSAAAAGQSQRQELSDFGAKVEALWQAALGLAAIAETISLVISQSGRPRSDSD